MVTQRLYHHFNKAQWQSIRLTDKLRGAMRVCMCNVQFTPHLLQGSVFPCAFARPVTTGPDLLDPSLFPWTLFHLTIRRVMTRYKRFPLNSFTNLWYLLHQWSSHWGMMLLSSRCKVRQMFLHVFHWWPYNEWLNIKEQEYHWTNFWFVICNYDW